MNFLKRGWKRFWFIYCCQKLGIPWKPDEYRLALKNYLNEQGRLRVGSVKIIGSLNINMEIGPLNIQVYGDLPPFSLSLKITDEALASVKKEWAKEVAGAGAYQKTWDVLPPVVLIGDLLVGFAVRWKNLLENPKLRK